MSEGVSRPQSEEPSHESRGCMVSFEGVSPINSELLRQIRIQVSGTGENTEKLNREVARYADNNPDHQAYLAVAEGRVVGYVEVDIGPGHFPKDTPTEGNEELLRIQKEFAHLARVGVTEDSEGRGIGSKLLSQAEEWVRSRNPNKAGLWLGYLADREGLVRFYEKNGYTTVVTFIDCKLGRNRSIAVKSFP